MAGLLRPHLTEKSAIGLNKGLYVFTVSPRANKPTIAAELKSLYNVDALTIRVVNLPAKKKVFRHRAGIRPVRRKVYIQLKANQTIPGFEVLNEKDKKNTTKEPVAAEETTTKTRTKKTEK